MIRRNCSSTSSLSRIRALSALAILLATFNFAAGCSDDEQAQEWDIKNPDAGGEADQDTDETDPDAGPQDDAASGDVEPTVRTFPVSVETVLSASSVSAGSTVTVDCQLFDVNGAPVAIPEGANPFLVFAPEQSFLPPEGLSLVPTVAGNAGIACQFPSLSLVDETPAELEILPGAPYTVTTDLDRNIITAGESATATCQVFDAYGNSVPNAVTRVTVDSSGTGVDIADHTVTITRSGVHQVSCTVDGAAEEHGELLEVNPGLPAHLAVSKVPDLAFYDIGQVVEVATIVTDEFANLIADAHVSFILLNPEPGYDNTFGHGRFRFEHEGTYTVVATVDPPTRNDVELTASVDIEVNGQGPDIECLSPEHGTMKSATPGSMVSFRGKVNDAQGVSKVLVNGTEVRVGKNGTFEHQVSTQFGINFVDISATDAAGGEFGQENSVTCAFLVADKWGSENQFMTEAVSLWLGQAAVDDRSTRGPLNSLNDVLHTVLSSDGLRDQLHSTMSAQNPLASGCNEVFGVCVNKYKIYYRGSRINGPHDTSLTLISNGLRLNAVVRNVELDLKVDSIVSPSGTVSVDSLSGTLEVTLTMQNGRPTIILRPNSVSVTATNPELSISGLPGWLNSIITSLVRGMVKNAVEEQVENFLKNQLQDVLDSLIAGLDITSLGSTFDVPRLDGAGTIGLSFGVNFSSLSVNTARALFGLGTKFSASPVTRATPSLGIPMPSGANLLTANPNRPIAAGVHVGALNHVLHALWRGGLFDANISSNAIGASFPPGTQISMTTGLPPVATLNGPQKVNLALGAIRMSIIYPGLFDEAIEIRVGAKAESSVDVQQAGSNATLNFSAIQIEELHFSPIGITLDSYSRGVLEGFLTGVLQNLIDTSLNNALPALPIPSFTLPATLNTYGLPGGDALGIVGPSLGGGGRHLQIKGNFGVLP